MFLLSGQPLKARDNSVFHHLDWWTCIIYVLLIVFGWFSVCGASYVFGETEILSFDSRSGMQLVWIGTSLVLALVLLLLDHRLYDTFAVPIYCVMVVLLFLTIFNPHEIRARVPGLHSALFVYSRQSLQSLQQRWQYLK